MFLKELLGRLASLSDSLAAKRIPSAAFLYDFPAGEIGSVVMA